MMRNLPIRRRLTLVVLGISLTVMLLMRGAFFTYELITFRQATLRHLSSLGRVLATNSTAALAFQNQDDAREILSAVRAEQHIVAAAIYDRGGRLFAKYPDALSDADLPAVVGAPGYRFEGTNLAGFEPIAEKGRQGFLYLRFDMGEVMREWLWGSLRIALAVMGLVLLIVWLLSGAVQKQISDPILALARTAQIVSERGDFSARAEKFGEDEVGRLVDSFNQMLGRIEDQDRELRQQENRLQTIIENLDEGLVVAGLEGQLLHFNRTALAQHGFKTLAEAPKSRREFGRLFEMSTMAGQALPNDDWPLARILRGQVLHDWEIRIRRPDQGWERVFNYGGLLVKDTEGRPMMAIVTIADITERKRAEDEILRLNDTLERRVVERTAELEAANKELESFSYSVSHDLRAPLRHIDGFAQLLHKRIGENLGDIDRRYLNNIITSAKGLGLLIDELLAFSRMGRTELRQSDVDVRGMVDETIREFQPETQARQIEWRVGPLPTIPADPAMLRQVWRNLIGNAIKYTRQRENTTIEISHRLTEAEGHVFAVRDNGAGFDMQYAAKLFGVFQRLHHANEFEGTGIGLANVRRIILRHGGRAWAEGEVGVGATFYFALPALNAAKAKSVPVLSS